MHYREKTFSDRKMDVEPLLAHREEKSYKSEFKSYRKEQLHQGVDLGSMGQSSSRNNRIQDALESDWSHSGSVISLNIQEILELKDVFKRLAKLSPEDQCISRQTFLHYFPLDGILGQRLFGMFDKDKDNKINAGEFLSGISLCLRGTMTDKSNLLFHMFDLDEDHGVSQDEMYRMLKPTLKAANSISRKSGQGIGSQGSDDFSDSAKLLVCEAFEECDKEQTGRLSLSNFQNWLHGHKEIVRAVFNLPFQSILRRSEYTLYGSEFVNEQDQSQNYDEVEMKEKRNNRLHAQNWMNEYNDSSFGEGEAVNVKLDSSKFLWSPLFPQSSSRFPPSRSKHAAVLYHGYIYVFGGRSKTSTLKDSWRYSLAENTWDAVKGQSGTPPPALEGHTAIVYKSQVFLFGGTFANDEDTPFWSYDLAQLSWKPLSQKRFQKEPLNRRGHTAVVYRDSMFIFGGVLDTGSATSEIWRYNFTTLRWHLLPAKEGSESITPRHSHTAVVHNSAMWIFGGVDSKGRKNDLWTWDLELFTWTKVRQKGGPLPLSRHSASKVGSLMLIFGGEGSDELHNETWAFNFDTIQWKKVTPLSSITPTHRCNHTTIALNPYSAHLGSNRPLTSKSAPDSYRTGLRNNNGAHHNFPRTGSVDSALDSHESRIYKGKSLDLTFELDNPGFEKSIPDVTNEDQNFEFSRNDSSVTEGTGIVQVQPYCETVLGDSEELSTYRQSHWSIVVIGGRGKHSTDLYKSSVDIWKCDIGPEVGSIYQTEGKTANAMMLGRTQRQDTKLGRRTERKVITPDEEWHPSDRGLLYLEARQRNKSREEEKLIITDLTTDEIDVISSNADTGSLLS